MLHALADTLLPARCLVLPAELGPKVFQNCQVEHRVGRVLAEFGTRLGDDMEIKVHDSTADMRYMVLPMRPDGTDGMSEEELAGLVTRDCMVGVTLPGT